MTTPLTRNQLRFRTVLMRESALVPALIIDTILLVSVLYAFLS